MPCRSEAVQLFLQSVDVCDSLQQSDTYQPAGHTRARQIHPGYFHQLGQCSIAESAEFNVFLNHSFCNFTGQLVIVLLYHFLKPAFHAAWLSVCASKIYCSFKPLRVVLSGV